MSWWVTKQLLVSVGGSKNGACFSWWVKKFLLKQIYLFELVGQKILLAPFGGSILIFTCNLWWVKKNYLSLLVGHFWSFYMHLLLEHFATFGPLDGKHHTNDALSWHQNRHFKSLSFPTLTIWPLMVLFLKVIILLVLDIFKAILKHGHP